MIHKKVVENDQYAFSSFPVESKSFALLACYYIDLARCYGNLLVSRESCNSDVQVSRKSVNFACHFSSLACYLAETSLVIFLITVPFFGCLVISRYRVYLTASKTTLSVIDSF